MRLIVFFLCFFCISCDTEEPNVKNELIGSYKGVINYYGGDPMPGDNQIERSAIIKIGYSGFSLLSIELPATTLIVKLEDPINSSQSDKIIPFNIRFTDNDITIECDSEINSWGKMCGYFGSNQNLYMNFGWSDANNQGAGFIIADKI